MANRDEERERYEQTRREWEESQYRRPDRDYAPGYNSTYRGWDSDNDWEEKDENADNRRREGSPERRENTGPERPTENFNAGYAREWTDENGPFTGVGPRGYQRSDERIKEEVCERLTRHGELDASQISLEVNQGMVTLKGEVNRREDKRLAEDIAESVSGVKDIDNQLRWSRQARDERSS